MHQEVDRRETDFERAIAYATGVYMRLKDQGVVDAKFNFSEQDAEKDFMHLEVEGYTMSLETFRICIAYLTGGDYYVAAASAVLAKDAGLVT